MNISKSSFGIFKRDFLLYVISFLTSIIISRNLGLIALGVWSILRLISAYGEVFARTRVEYAAVYFIGKVKMDKNVVFTSINFVLLISIFFLSILVLNNYDNLYDLFFRQIDHDYHLEFNLTLLSLPCQLIYLSYNYFFVALEDFKNFNKVTVLNNVLLSILSILSVSITSLGLKGVAFVYIISPLIASIYSLILLPNHYFLNLKLNLKATFSLLKYGFQFFITALFAELQESGTRLITASFLSPSYVAFLAQGERYAQLLERLNDPLRIALLPRISRSSDKDSIELTCKGLRVSFIISFVSSLLLVLIIKPFIILVYGKEFEKIANVIYIIIPGLFLKNLSMFFNTYFAGIGKELINSYTQIFPGIFQLFLSWYLINKYGFEGACISLLIGFLFFSAIYFTYFIYVNNLNINFLIPNKKDFNYVANFLLAQIKSIFGIQEK